MSHELLTINNQLIIELSNLKVSEFQRSKIPRFQDSKIPRFQDSKISKNKFNFSKFVEDVHHKLTIFEILAHAAGRFTLACCLLGVFYVSLLKIVLVRWCPDVVSLVSGMLSRVLQSAVIFAMDVVSFWCPKRVIWHASCV